ncbi:MAG: FG-GAP-like repeat-containing protein [Actinomycetota bacterium]|nr:FG-GAP-like repeat-containing protein [Actinomycetota bacterium]
MHFSRSRYVTICQQFLVTAVVVAVGLSAAGVMTLQIVAPPAPVAGADLVPAVVVRAAVVDTTPVTPKVREVRVTGVDKQALAASPPGRHTNGSLSQPGRMTSGGSRALRLAVLTRPEKVSGFATVGVTWAHGIRLAENQINLAVRSEKSGVWSNWTKLAYHDDHGPDPSSPDAKTSRPGTDPLVVGSVDAVQLRAETVSGTPPAGIRLALIDPGIGKTRNEAAAIDTAKLASARQGTSSGTSRGTSNGSSNGSSNGVALQAMKVAPKPQIFSRAQWGANENMRNKSALTYGTVETGFIHHTVDANNYTAADVPALIRGIYAYHTQSRGWSDIGYNFLIDRFGRIWEGRYGGVDRAVVGAHTLGYNEVSFAASAIGNFDIYDNGRGVPPQALLNAEATLFAWKLSLADIRADNSHIWVKNRWLQAINGHRDANSTACPGRYLYAKLPSIRVAARQIQLNAQTPTPPPPPNPTQPPGAAVPQPSGMTFPARESLTGSSAPDLVLKSPGGAISVLPTGGLTGYRSPVTTAGAWRDLNAVVAVGDVTGDGQGDVLGRTGATGWSRVYPGRGDGQVDTGGVAATSTFGKADLLLGAGDLTGDGRNDLITRTAKTGALYLYPGTGAGRFAKPQLMRKAWGDYVSTVVAGDLNNDGRPDLVAIGKDGGLWVIPGLGGSHLGTPIRRVSVGTQYDLVGGGDLTGDGVGDIVMRNAGNGLMYLFPGRGGYRFGHFDGPFGGMSDLSLMSSGQLVGGKQPDIVGRSSTGSLVVVPANGLSNLLPRTTSNMTVPDANQVLDVGDWNRDGRSDVIVRQQSKDLLVLRLGLGTGGFGKPRVMGAGWRSITGLSAAGDVTGDGHPDLVGRGPGGVMTIFPGDGRFGFKAPRKAADTIRTYNQIGTGSWPSGKWPGSALRSSDGSFVPFTGSDSASALARAGAPASAYDWVIGVGDVDGNGVPDLLVREKATGYLWMLPGTGSGFGVRQYVGAGFGSYTLGG